MKFESYLLHPELRNKSDTYLTLRSSIWSRWWFPADERVGWYGGAIREDGGNGMYMTGPQAWTWKDWNVMPGIKVGPF